MIKNVKTESFPIRAVKGIAFYIIAQIMSLFVYMSILAMSDGLIFRVFCALCTSAITLGFMFNWSYNAAKTDMALERNDIKPMNPKMPVIMACTVTVIPIVMLCLLLLGKLGIMGETMNIYILLDMWTSPFISLFTKIEIGGNPQVTQSPISA
jgi:hypothetical protein